MDAAASPREGAVSPTPDSELPKITVTPQGDSPRSQTSNKTHDAENANETPRPVTRMQKRGDRICLNLIGSSLASFRLTEALQIFHCLSLKCTQEMKYI